MSKIIFATRHSARTRAIGLVVAGSCVLLLAATHRWFHPHRAQVAAAAGSVTAPNSNVMRIEGEPLPERDYRKIAQWHLFGKPAAAISERDEQPEGIAAGRLPLSGSELALTGVLYSGDEVTTLAIVAHASSKEKTYAVGDTLPSEGKLHQIERTRIVIRRDGRFEEVRLPRWGAERGGLPSQDDAGQRAESKPRKPMGRPFVSTAPAS